MRPNVNSWCISELATKVGCDAVARIAVPSGSNMDSRSPLDELAIFVLDLLLFALSPSLFVDVWREMEDVTVEDVTGTQRLP